MKHLFFLTVALLLAACSGPVVKGTITYVDSYGSAHTSFTIEDMLAEGFNYSDIVKAEFEKSGTYIMPITTAYTEVGIGKPSYCHYSKKGETSFGYCQGDFSKMCGGIPGEKVKITQLEEFGYLPEYELIQSVYYTEREKYSSDSIFANFREIKTDGMKPELFYRSGNPMNWSSNPVRYAYVDTLAEKRGIKAEIDIANTASQDSAYVENQSYACAGYCAGLLKSGNVCCLGLGSDTFCEKAYQGMAKSCRFILEHDGPFLIHCNEGKDRCGFWCMVLEALAGAPADQLEYDYMTTFCNLYFFERNTDAYNFNLTLTGDRLMYLLSNPGAMQVRNFDWDAALDDITTANMKAAAESFLINQCGMTPDEVGALEYKISDPTIEGRMPGEYAKPVWVRLDEFKKKGLKTCI